MISGNQPSSSRTPRAAGAGAAVAAPQHGRGLPQHAVRVELAPGEPERLVRGDDVTSTRAGTQAGSFGVHFEAGTAPVRYHSMHHRTRVVRAPTRYRRHQLSDLPQQRRRKRRPQPARHPPPRQHQPGRPTTIPTLTGPRSGARCTGALTQLANPDPPMSYGSALAKRRRRTRMVVVSNDDRVADPYAALAEGRWVEARSASSTALAGDQTAEPSFGLAMSLWWLGENQACVDQCGHAYVLFRRWGTWPAPRIVRFGWPSPTRRTSPTSRSQTAGSGGPSDWWRRSTPGSLHGWLWVAPPTGWPTWTRPRSLSLRPSTLPVVR